MPQIIGDVQELITTVSHVAQSEAQKAREEAEQKAEKIRREAEQRAAGEREDILQNARERAKELRRRRKARGSREDRRDFLEARQELLDQVWQQAEQRLRELTEDSANYAAVLNRLVLASVRTSGPGERLIAADAKGQDLLTEDRLQECSQQAGEDLPGSVTFERAPEPLDTWGGLVVQDKEGRRRIDATFALRLELAKDEIQTEVLQKLVES